MEKELSSRRVVFVSMRDLLLYDIIIRVEKRETKDSFELPIQFNPRGLYYSLYYL